MEMIPAGAMSTAGQLIGDEYRLLRGVRDQVVDLRDDLAAMNALFSMHSAAEDGSVDPFTKELMKQVRELGYDAEDCVDLYRLRVRCRPGDGFLTRWRHRLVTLLERRRLAGKITALRTRTVAIRDRYQRFGFSLEVLRTGCPPAQAAGATAAYVVRHPRGGAIGGDPCEHHDFVGMDKQANDLANKMKERVDGEHRLRVFSIVGFGGVGKSTLAMELCRRLETDFPYQAMVSVSQTFEPGRDRKALLERVLGQIVKPKKENERGVREEGTLGNISSLNEEQLSRNLKEILKDKRCIIVIDDVWAIRAWESIESKLLPAENSSCNSRIILTTRIETVAQACCSDYGSEHYVHHMKPLETEYSKILFLRRVFGAKDATCPEDLREVMDKILKKCGGLPLAIVGIASILAGYRSPGSIDKWEAVCRSIGFEMESNPTLEGMRQIVTLSYDHLPRELKGCMMYLSIFPEDFEIDKDRLLGRWIAEGLIPAVRGLTPMEVAEYYLDELVSRNMVQPCFSSDGSVNYYLVHDVHLEVMVSKSLESNFVSLVGGQYAAMSYDRIRRLSIHGDVKRSQDEAMDSDLEDRGPRKEHGHKRENCVEWMAVEHVRSLSMFHVQGHKLLDQLEKFTLLRVLDLEDCKLVTDHHLVCACRLYLLRFLNLKGTKIRKVPHQIKNLQHLQTFNTSGTLVEELPETITQLENLETLKLHGCPGWWRLPRGLSRMKALHNLDGAFLGGDVEIAKELGKLEQLQYLNVFIDSTINKDFEEEVNKSLSKMYSLRMLQLTTYNRFQHRLMEPPRLLQTLFITGGIDGGLPAGIAALTCLKNIYLSEAEFTDNEQPYSILYKLPNLRNVVLRNARHTSNELVARSSHNFPALTTLRLINPQQLSALRFEEESMSKLEKLYVTFNSSWTIVGIKHLTSLKEVKLAVPDHGESNEISRAVDKLKSEIRSHLNKCQLIVVHDMYDLFK